MQRIIVLGVGLLTLGWLPSTLSQTPLQLRANGNKNSEEDAPMLTEKATQATCAIHTCPSDYVPILQNLDSTTVSDENCCQATCAIHTCPSNYVPILQNLDSTTVSDENCCQAIPYIEGSLANVKKPLGDLSYATEGSAQAACNGMADCAGYYWYNIDLNYNLLFYGGSFSLSLGRINGGPNDAIGVVKVKRTEASWTVYERQVSNVNIIWKGDVSNLDECRVKCNELPACVAISYSGDRRYCHTHSSVVGRQYGSSWSFYSKATNAQVERKVGIFVQVGNAEIWPDLLSCLEVVAEANAEDGGHLGVHISFAEGFGPSVSEQRSIKSDVEDRLLGQNKSVHFSVFDNIGMDIGPFIRQIATVEDAELKYDLLLKIHTKTDPCWREVALQSLCGSTAQVKAILNSFAMNDDMDMIAPAGLALTPSTPESQVAPAIYRCTRSTDKSRQNGQRGNFFRRKTMRRRFFSDLDVQGIRKLSYLISPDVMLGEPDTFAVVAGSMFWIRYEALRPKAWQEQLPALLPMFTRGYKNGNQIEHAIERFIPTLITHGTGSVYTIPVAPKVFAIYSPLYHTAPEKHHLLNESMKSVPLNAHQGVMHSVVRQRQAAMARKHGVHGFMFYHYWFTDPDIGYRAVMDEIPQKMLEDGYPDMPFFFSWANEPWKRQDEGDLIAQKYGEKADWEQHAEYLMKFFKNEKYLKSNNKPVFAIDRAGHIGTELALMKDTFHEIAKQHGFSGIYYISTIRAASDSAQKRESPSVDMDSAFHFLPSLYVDTLTSAIAGHQDLPVLEEPRVIATNRDLDFVEGERQFGGAFVGFDNRTSVLTDIGFRLVPPERFEDALTTSFVNMNSNDQVSKLQHDGLDGLFFVASWNGWNEQCLMEPHEKLGFSFLHALKSSLEHVEPFKLPTTTTTTSAIQETLDIGADARQLSLEPSPEPEPEPEPEAEQAGGLILFGDHAAGEITLRLSDVSQLSAGMSLTISGVGNSETKNIVAANPDRRLVSRRLVATGTVTIDSPLQNAYLHGSSIVVIPHRPQATCGPLNLALTGKNLSLLSPGAGRGAEDTNYTVGARWQISCQPPLMPNEDFTAEVLTCNDGAFVVSHEPVNPANVEFPSFDGTSSLVCNNPGCDVNYMRNVARIAGGNLSCSTSIADAMVFGSTCEIQCPAMTPIQPSGVSWQCAYLSVSQYANLLSTTPDVSVSAALVNGAPPIDAVTSFVPVLAGAIHWGPVSCGVIVCSYPNLQNVAVRNASGSVVFVGDLSGTAPTPGVSHFECAGFQLQSTCTLYCQDGYIPKGDGNLVCNGFAHGDGNQGSRYYDFAGDTDCCSLPALGGIPITVNGDQVFVGDGTAAVGYESFDCSSLSIGATCSWTCSPSFYVRAESSFTIQCNVQPEVNGCCQAPVLPGMPVKVGNQTVYTGAGDKPVGYEYLSCPSFEYGAFCTWVCSAGWYRSIGNASGISLDCTQPNGLNNGCTQHTCDTLPSITSPATIASSCDGQPPGYHCDITCPSDTGHTYSLVGQTYFYCNQGVYERPAAEFCAPDDCNYVPQPMFGPPHNNCSGLAHGSKCWMRCGDGFSVPPGKEEFTCLAGTWDIQTACLLPSIVEGGATGGKLATVATIELVVDLGIGVPAPEGYDSWYDWAIDDVNQGAITETVAEQLGKNLDEIMIQIAPTPNSGGLNRRLQSIADATGFIVRVMVKLSEAELNSGLTMKDITEAYMASLVGTPSAGGNNSSGGLFGGNGTSGGASPFITALVAKLEAQGIAVPPALRNANVFQGADPQVIENFLFMPSSWFAYDWGACDNTCGDGTHFRKVVCSAGGSACANARPAKQEGCQDFEGCPFDPICPMGKGKSPGCGAQLGIIFGIAALVICCYAMCCIRYMRRKLKRPNEGKVLIKDGLDDLKVGFKVLFPQSEDVKNAKKGIRRGQSESSEDVALLQSAHSAHSGKISVISDDRLSLGNTEDGRIHVVWEIDMPKVFNQHVTKDDPYAPMEESVDYRMSQVPTEVDADVMESVVSCGPETPRSDLSPPDLSPTGNNDLDAQNALAVVGEDDVDAIADENVKEPPKIFVQDGTRMEYWSVSHKKWVIATVRTEVNMEEFSTEAMVRYHARIGANTKTNVDIDCLRRPFDSQDLVEVYSATQGWVPGVINGPQLKFATLYGYQVRVLKPDSETVLDQVSPSRLRSRYPPGLEVSMFLDDLGWVNAEVDSTAPVDGVGLEGVPISRQSLDGLLTRAGDHEDKHNLFARKDKQPKKEAKRISRFDPDAIAAAVEEAELSKAKEEATTPRSPSRSPRQDIDIHNLRGSWLDEPLWVLVPVRYEAWPEAQKVPSFKLRAYNKWNDSTNERTWVTI